MRSSPRPNVETVQKTHNTFINVNSMFFNKVNSWATGLFLNWTCFPQKPIFSHNSCLCRSDLLLWHQKDSFEFLSRESEKVVSKKKLKNKKQKTKVVVCCYLFCTHSGNDRYIKSFYLKIYRIIYFVHINTRKCIFSFIEIFKHLVPVYSYILFQ